MDSINSDDYRVISDNIGKTFLASPTNVSSKIEAEQQEKTNNVALKAIRFFQNAFKTEVKVGGKTYLVSTSDKKKLDQEIKTGKSFGEVGVTEQGRKEIENWFDQQAIPFQNYDSSRYNQQTSNLINHTKNELIEHSKILEKKLNSDIQPYEKERAVEEYNQQVSQLQVKLDRSDSSPGTKLGEEIVANFSIDPKRVNSLQQAITESKVTDVSKEIKPEKAQKKPRKSSFSLSDIKSNETGLERLGFSKIGSGAEKLVVVPNRDEDKAAHMGKVFYVPVRMFFISRKAALMKERAKMEDIKKNADTTNLAVESEEVKVGGSYAMKVEAAKGDFEQEIQNPKLSKEERVLLGRDYIKGLADLHFAGYAYGDIKPENSLVYENEKRGKHVKISDFGKAEKMGPDESKTFKGNLRFAPPEGKLSQKGDVYGTGLVLIRSLEEKYLEKGKPLQEIDKKDKEDVRTKKRGIEQFITKHKAFLGMDSSSRLGKFLKRLPRQRKLGNLSDEVKETQSKALNAYVDELGEKMKADFSDEQVDKFKTLMKKMLATNPADRPTMREVEWEYNEIFSEEITKK